MIKVLTAFSLALFTVIAGAQSYPARPVTLISPFPPGGSTDTTARIIAEAMRGPLGQTVVVETVAGASHGLDDDRLCERPTHRLGNHARRGIGRAARRKRRDQRHRPCRIGLRSRHDGEKRKRECREYPYHLLLRMNLSVYK